MYENNPNQPPPPSSGMGCIAKGCLTLFAVGALLVVMMMGFGWYVMHSVVAPFLGDRPAAIRVYPATEAQYEAVQQKTAPFVEAVNAGHAATLALTADDLNILIARDDRPTGLRGTVYLTIDRNTVIADVSYPLDGRRTTSRLAAGAPTKYFNGRVAFDGSFAEGEFTLVLRKIEPLGGGAMPGLIGSFLDNPGFSSSFNRSFNDGFRESIRRNEAATNLIDRLQTVIVQDNQVIITAAASAVPVATPAASP